MADRLYIDKSINEEVIPQIDSTQLLNLDISNSERIELFLFAMSIGIKMKKRTPIKVKHGFILETSIKSVDGASSQLFSVLVNELREINEEDKIDDKDYAFKIAEEYANTGFLEIKKWLDPKKDKEDLIFSLLEDIEEKFEKINEK